ncbi:MAG TPA: pepsin/retropepsin-like aspartic protease family protein [Rhizomicrobium sp.]|nr:pepsin/retropepsin-like aspartic protease family protein [Rhizomicrobium sp.]
MKIAPAAIAALAFLACGSAWADSCPPLTVLSSNDMVSHASGLVLVPATLGTGSKLMLIDTGHAASEITPQAAQALHLDTYDKPVSGNSPQKMVLVSPFLLGNLRARALDFKVGDAHGLGSDAAIGGAIATDILSTNDVEFDFARGKFNLLSSDHCDGKVVYWQAPAVSVVAMTISADGAIAFPVTLDGHTLTAALDTGATATYLRPAAAKREFGAGPHAFQSLAFEGVAIANPAIMPGSDQNDAADSATAPSLVIGLDVLRHLHVYIAYREHKLYITPR